VKLTASEQKQLEDWAGFFSFIPTLPFKWLINCQSKTICVYTGNQFGKTDMLAMDVVLRIIGQHPVSWKNVRPEDPIRTFRFASETLPAIGGDESGTKNTQYPAFKRRLPPSLVKKDITDKNKTMTIRSLSGGPDIFVEFVAYSQGVGAQAGVQRRMVWLDESASRSFFDEQVPRLMAADGDLIYTMTPEPGLIGWEFDELYERASCYLRTPKVLKRLRERLGERHKAIEKTGGSEDLTVIMAATDDNPIYPMLAKKRSEQVGKEISAQEYINDKLRLFDADEDVTDARRYGLFRHLSGKIFKTYTPSVHLIDGEKYFETGIPHDWHHFRGIDFHTFNPWAVVWLSVSPQDEIFVWEEFAPDPGKTTSWESAKLVAARSGDYKYRLDLMDPLGKDKQPNTGTSPMEDMNVYATTFKREGLGTGAYWQSWDTKNERGMDEFRKRLANSLRVGKPFNNKNPNVGPGEAPWLPTIWILNRCKICNESLKNWRREEWLDRNSKLTKDEKDKPQQKHSHFPRTIECLLKRDEVSKARFVSFASKPIRPKHYLTGASV
jgi:hypothetical protein